jgi:1-acyl-sn-glycerol-3-phosphate acyltransferase
MPEDIVTRGRARAITQALASALIMTIAAAIALLIGALTLFRARRLYAALARLACRAILRVYGVRVRVTVLRTSGACAVTTSFVSSSPSCFVPSSPSCPTPCPTPQVVYVSNHTSTLDLFVLVALGLPNTRFFLSGYLRTFVPLGIIATMMGTFFTVPQEFPERRRRIFARAAEVLRRTGESVYLSPEGGRITDGRIGHFNKGAFHLATALKAPIVPMYFRIPREIDPGLGYAAKPGVVDVYVLPAIDTAEWREADLIENKERVRALFQRTHEELRCA